MAQHSYFWDKLNFNKKAPGYAIFVDQAEADVAAAGVAAAKAVRAWAEAVDTVLSVMLIEPRGRWVVAFARKLGAHRALENVRGSRAAAVFGAGAESWLATAAAKRSREEPLLAAQCVAQLNAFAPLQWSSAIEVCEVARFCKRGRSAAAPDAAPGAAVGLGEGFGAGMGAGTMGASTAGVGAGAGAGGYVPPADALAELEALFPDVLQPLFEMDARTHALIYSASVVPAAAASLPSAAAADETDLPPPPPLVLPLPPVLVGELPEDQLDSADARRQAAIWANMQQNPALSICSVHELAERARLVALPQVLRLSRPFPAARLPQRLVITQPDAERIRAGPGRPPASGPSAVMKRLCVFVRQQVIFHNADGSEAQSCAASGCGCRHRIEYGEAALAARPSISFVPAPTAQQLLHQRLPAQADDCEWGEQCAEADCAAPARDDADALDVAPEHDGSAMHTGPRVVLFGTTAAPAQPLPRPVATGPRPSVPPPPAAPASVSAPAPAPADDEGPLPLSQQFSQLTQAAQQGHVDARRVADGTLGRLRARSAVKSRVFTQSDLFFGLPVKNTVTESFRLATLGLELRVPKDSTPAALRAGGAAALLAQSSGAALPPRRSGPASPPSQSAGAARPQHSSGAALLPTSTEAALSPQSRLVASATAVPASHASSSTTSSSLALTSLAAGSVDPAIAAFLAAGTL